METKKSKPSLIISIRNNFTAGVLVLAPSAVTIWILVKVFRWFDNILGKWYTQFFEYLEVGVTHYPGLGALTLFIIITLIGIVTRHYVGKKLVQVWESAITRVPLINRVYIAVRQLADAFSKGSGIIFEKPVIVEYPRKGLFSMGFVTRRCEGPFCQLVGKDVSTVFIPTTPNPTSGVVIFVPQEEIISIDMTVEDAMKLVISAGAVSPEIKLPATRE